MRPLIRRVLPPISNARSAVTRIEVLVITVLGLFLLGTMLPSIQATRETGPLNTCRNNHSNLAKAVFSYQNRTGMRLPGYINALTRNDGALYIDPDTGEPTPVSWAVMILPDLDRQTTFEQWRSLPDDSNAKAANVVQTGDNHLLRPSRPYIELFVCPSNCAGQRSGTPINYSVNTGQADAPLSSTVPNTETAGGLAIYGIPRDWRSNGLFFDIYTSDPQVTRDAMRRPPAVIMRSVLCRRPLDKILLLMENVDAGDYVLNVDRDSADDWRGAEATLGATWSADIVEPDGKTLRKRPQPPALHPNERVGQGNGSDMAFARPSSRHPGGFNVAYVGQNVQFMSDKIDYYVYAKLMTTSDKDLMLPGTRTPIAALGDFQPTDEQINP